jgi:2-oxo-4-hydroxy-4-carboxy-5-ureidoimidazoline decarboxylase
MTITVAQLDTMSESEAAFKLAACCGSSRWVAEMVRRRPFSDPMQLFSAGEEVASQLTDDDWREAFSHHPKIGERKASAKVSTTAASWSKGEQASTGRVSGAIRDALSAANAEYERKFGFIFIICATGLSADEILSALLARLENTPEQEMIIAAGEQRKITRLRLEKLVAARGQHA